MIKIVYGAELNWGLGKRCPARCTNKRPELLFSQYHEIRHHTGLNVKTQGRKKKKKRSIKQSLNYIVVFEADNFGGV